jgi:hypothetical protein
MVTEFKRERRKRNGESFRNDPYNKLPFVSWRK